MPPWRELLLLLLLLLSTLLCFHETEAGTFVYAGCSPSKFQPNTPFQSNLNGLLSSLVASAAQASYNSFAVGNDSSSPPGSAAYGLYQCRTDLNTADCSACVQSTVAQIGLVCPDATAASLQLEPCLVRYSSDDFLGRLDTSLVYRKCSPSTSDGDEEFFRRRDDVIAGMQTGAMFRVSSSGPVQGYAQCLGDLTAGDCVACLGQALGQLESACGSAMAADVFLAQCYARYWASGYYLRYTTDNYSEDNIGKTVAIIVGIVAGLAVFVVFISFLKRVCKSPIPPPVQVFILFSISILIICFFHAG